MIRPGLYRDINDTIVRVIAADEDGIVLHYPDGTVLTVTA